jgi:hypothetical protein
VSARIEVRGAWSLDEVGDGAGELRREGDGDQAVDEERPLANLPAKCKARLQVVGRSSEIPFGNRHSSLQDQHRSIVAHLLRVGHQDPDEVALVESVVPFGCSPASAEVKMLQ